MAPNPSSPPAPLEAIWKEQSKPQQDGEGVTIDPQRLEAVLNDQDFEYRNEGRANAVFAIKEKDSDNRLFRGTLLRVPKVVDGVTRCDYKTLHDFHEEVRPKLGQEFVVPEVLVEINEDTAKLLNQRRTECSFGGKKDDGGIVRAGLATLVQDMMPHDDNLLTVEFKPKWLAQSPLAPEDASRCRSCAREAYRSNLKRDAARGTEPRAPAGATLTAEAVSRSLATTPSPTPSPAPGPPVCPLGLVHSEPWVVASTIDRLVPEWPEGERKRLRETLELFRVLSTLRELQTDGDPSPGDKLYREPEDPKFGLSMTLRDCSCFVMMPKSDKDTVTIKLGDLDKKNAKEKYKYWQKMHDDLLNEGWYTGKEQAPVETACILWLNRCLKDNREYDIPAAFRDRRAEHLKNN